MPSSTQSSGLDTINKMESPTNTGVVNTTEAVAAVEEIHVQAAKQVAASAAGSSLKSFLSGGVGGMMAVLVGHPFDLVKVRMQTGAVGAGSASVFGIMRHTMATEGIRGLYRGVSAPIVAVSPIYALSFWGYDIGQRIVHEFRSSTGPLSLTEIAIAGGISAFPATAVMAPTERIKCLLQVQSHGPESKPRYSGMTDCAVQVYREGGIRSLYKGTMLTLMRDVPGSIAWFGTYEIVKRELTRMQGIEDPSQLSPLAVLVAGGLAGMACWGVCIPPDVLKSRYQTAPEGKYKNIVDVYRTLVKEEGFGALFTGFRPAMIRAFPANAACFLGMEIAKSALTFLDRV